MLIQPSSCHSPDRGNAGSRSFNDQPIVEIEWGEKMLCPPTVSLGMTDAAHGCEYHDDVSIARVNVIPVDHGLTVEPSEASVSCHSHYRSRVLL